MKDELLQFIKDDLLSTQANLTLQADDDLLTTALVDSMGVMRIISFIEEKSGVSIPPEDVTIDNFISVDAICVYLSQRSA